MPDIRLLLGSLLIKDSLSTLLSEAGFSVIREPALSDDDATVLIDFDDCLDPEGIRAHQQRGAKIAVLASRAGGLTMSDDQIALLSGVLTCDLSAADFVRSLRLICLGERVFPRDLIVDRNPAQPADNDLQNGRCRLSPREKEVLLQVVEGRSNKLIARHLGMAEATVKVHLKSLLRKIGVDNRTQAAIWALTNLPELTIRVAA
jgi:two-component system nitrate/nitrite response regulator NarL